MKVEMEWRRGSSLEKRGTGASASHLRLGNWGDARVLLVGTSSGEPLDREL